MRWACSIVVGCALALVGLSGCGGGHRPVTPPCCPAGYGSYALEISAAGRVRWQVPLGGAPLGGGQRMSPLAAGPDAVFAQDDALYGLRLADGRRLWSRTLGQDIAGLWRWQGLVVALTDGAGGWPLLTGLDASTGQARWSQSIVGGVVGPYPTADGGLALLRADDTLEVVNLSSGRVRWKRPAGYPPGAEQVYPPPLTAADGAVVLAAGGELTSYDDRTGRIRWADALPGIEVAADAGELNLLAGAGLVYLTGSLPGVGDDDGQPVQALLGLSAADGRVRWRFAASPTEALWAYAPGLMSVGSGPSGDSGQDDLDPATGRVRWRVASAYHALAAPDGVVTASGPDGADQISLRDPLTGQIRWTTRLAGPDAGWQRTSPDLPVFPVGPVLIVAAARLAGPGPLAAVRLDDGQRAWQVTIPEPPAAAPTAVAGGTLVYAADLRLPP